MLKVKAALLILVAVLLVTAVQSFGQSSDEASREGRGGAGGGTVGSNIGATISDAPDGGALLESVNSPGRAYRFGLEEGDIVLSINDQAVEGAESFIELMYGVERGAVVSIQVLRDDVETTVGRETARGGRGGARGDDETDDASTVMEDGTFSSNIGATFIDAPDGGALVESIESRGRATRFGLEQSDIVLSINDQAVEDAQSCIELINGVERGAAVSIKVIRTVGREAASAGRGRTDTNQEDSETDIGTIGSNIGATVSDAPDGGALLESIESRGRATRFGLEEGDIVLSINDQTVDGAESFIELMYGVERGAAVSIQVLRDGEEISVGREAVSGERGSARRGQEDDDI